MSAGLPKVGVGGLVVVEDRVLLIRRGKAPLLGRWSIPGGTVESGETLEQALIREMAEETGLDVVPGRLLTVFDRIEKAALEIGEGLAKAAKKHGIDVTVQQVGSMGCMYFIDRAVENFADAGAADEDRFYRFHAAMLERGVYLAPSPYEAFFVGAGHGPEEVEQTLAAAKATFAEL